MTASSSSQTLSYGRVTVPSFDRIAVEVLGGLGLVARAPGAVLVVAQPASNQQWQAAETLVAQVAQSCRNHPRAPGMDLVQVVTTWHTRSPSISLGLLAATDDGLALCLSGSAEASMPSTGHRLRAQDENGWLIRMLGWTDAAILIALGPGETGTAARAYEHAVLDLQSGVVPGYGVRLATPGRSGAASVDARPQRLDQLPPPPPPPAAEEPGPSEIQLDLPPQARASVLFGAEEPLPPRAPLPVAAAPEQPAAPLVDHDHPHPLAASVAEAAAEASHAPAAPVEEGVVVDGFLCSRGHLNDPRGHFCAQCGIRMAELTGVITKGRRPPLGLLLFDNGATFVLDHDYLIGREPESDPEVRAGGLRPLALFDQVGGISRRHAEIRLSGWDVVLIDRGSANGTLVALRHEAQWRAVVPGQPIPLLPGMRISMGRRTLSFETPHRTT